MQNAESGLLSRFSNSSRFFACAKSFATTFKSSPSEMSELFADTVIVSSALIVIPAISRKANKKDTKRFIIRKVLICHGSNNTSIFSLSIIVPNPVFSNKMQVMVHFFFLCAHISFVVLVRRNLNGYILHNLNAVTF